MRETDDVSRLEARANPRKVPPEYDLELERRRRADGDEIGGVEDDGLDGGDVPVRTVTANPSRDLEGLPVGQRDGWQADTLEVGGRGGNGDHSPERVVDDEIRPNGVDREQGERRVPNA